MTILVGNWMWEIKMVSHHDDRLIDRTGERTLGVTDVLRHTVYLDESLDSYKFRKVFLHEIGHCIMASYGYLSDIHRIVPKEYWVLAEEWVCNFLAEHSDEAVRLFDRFYREREVYDKWGIR